MPADCSSLILLPVGPGTHLPFLLDTLETIERFAAPDHRTLLADDSGESIGELAKEKLPQIDVLVLRRPGQDTKRSVAGRFFETIATCITHAVQNYSFRCLMRMDADALMCNPGADVKAIETLEAHPNLALIGSYRFRCDGEKRDFTGSGEILKREAGAQLLPRKRALPKSLDQLLQPALKNGYELGEHITAPGSALSRAAAERLVAHPLFGHPSFRPTRLGDDHLISLMLISMGLKLGDFATGDLPLGVWLRKLEWSPEDLVAKGKCVVHSVRGYQALNEEQVRERFRTLRS